MNRLLILLTIPICTSFVHQKGKTPYLAKLTITIDRDACNAPNAVFEQKYTNKNLILSFGYDDYFEKQDTIDFSYKNDSLFIKLVKRNKPRIVLKDGVPDTLPGRRDDPDCECFTLFRLEIQNLPKKPKYFVVNKYFNDEKLGFVDGKYLNQIKSKIEVIETSKKLQLDSVFIVTSEYKSYPKIDDNVAWYLKHRGSLSIVVLDADTETEKKLVSQLQKLFIKKEMICPSRISSVLERNFNDKDSTSINVKISDTKSFLFSDYNWRGH